MSRVTRAALEGPPIFLAQQQSSRCVVTLYLALPHAMVPESAPPTDPTPHARLVRRSIKASFCVVQVCVSSRPRRRASA